MLYNVKVNRDLLKELREKNELSVSDVANYLGYKTPSGYWLLESNNQKDPRNVSVANLYALSRLYKLPMEKLLIVEVIKQK